MSVNGITNNTAAYTQSTSTSTAAKQADATKNKSTASEEAGVVYEPSKAKDSDSKKITDY